MGVWKVRFLVVLLSYFLRTFGGIIGYRVCNHVLHSACLMVSYLQFLWLGVWGWCVGFCDRHGLNFMPRATVGCVGGVWFGHAHVLLQVWGFC